MAPLMETPMKGFNLSALAVRERPVTLFLMLALLVAGLYAFINLGRAEDPAFTIKQLTVSVAWPGADAEQMQDLVAEPLEKRLQELRWYDRVTTEARPGMAILTLALRDNTPPDQVPEQFYQARKKLGDESGKLPSGVLGPYVNDEFSDDNFALYALQAPGLPQRQLLREAEVLRQALLQVAGVKKVNVIGEQPERIFVEFSVARLASLGISPADVFAALHKQNAVAAAGSIDTRGPQVRIRLDGGYDGLGAIRDTPLRAGGNSLRLGDIATVDHGYEDPPGYLIRNDGEPALMLGVIMREGANGLKLGKALAAERARLQAGLPLGMQLVQVSDQSVNIRRAVDEFMLKFMVALAVVMLVSLISLGWRVGLVVAAAVPLTLACVFVIMQLSGRMFDRITLGALILALGLLVDDAIIAIEAMVVRMQAGWDRVTAASWAWSHTAAPMLAGTLVTIIGLMPVGFASSSAGEYAGNIFWIVGFALLASWVVAVVFTPYLGVKLLPAIKPIPGGHAAVYDTPSYHRLRAAVSWAIRHKFGVAALVFGAFLLSGLGMGAVSQQFFPSSDRPELLVELRMPPGSAIEATHAAVVQVEQWLKQQPEAAIVTSYIGQGAPRFFLSMAPELPDPAFAKLVVRTPGPHERDAIKRRLRLQIAHGLAPQARVRVTQLVFGPYSPWPVAFRISGPDPETLRKLASDVETVMRAQPDLRQVNVDWSDRAPTLHFQLDQDRLRQIGLTPQDAAQQLQFLLNGIAVSTLREDIRDVPIIARAASAARHDPAQLAGLDLVTEDGHRIPVEQLGHMQVDSEAPLLIRRDRIPTITAQADIADHLQPPDVSSRVYQALAPLIAALPAGYRIEMAGPIEESAKANKALLPVFPVMLLLTLLVIMLQVRSFAAMAMVVLTAPLGLVGAVPALLLLHQPFGFNAILGLIGLSGILMRNTLILIGQIDTNRKAGLEPHEAVVEATVQRARPVLLTALAAVLAFIPLSTSVFWGAMAVTLIGGTAVGTVLTLVFLPALYALWFRVRAAESGAPEGEPLPA